MEDKRFAHIKTDPKFRRIPKGERTVKIDKRFQSMFKDKKFKVKYTIDKRGRPVNHTSTEDLKRYYELDSDEENDSSTGSESDEDNEPSSEEPGKFVRPPKNDSDNPESEDENVNRLDVKHKSDKKIPDEIKTKLRDLNVDYARGESTLFSDSSSDDEETDEDLSEGETLEHKWGELDADAEKTDETTHRLAACNMDWDRIRAIDLMVLFNSFIPTGGLIESVVIYPSEFGKQRMKEEDVKGPTELVESTKPEKDGDNDENEEGSMYHMEKLRQYQLNRLKYYYAVVTCDSVDTANKIYTECDGMEYESSATKIDLRFIPNDMTFDDEPKESCSKLPEVNKYQPRFFTTKALQQAKVDLTWDETNPDRVEMTQKLSSGKIDEVTDADLQTYLAPSSGEESDEDKPDVGSGDEDSKENPIDKYKALLQEIENQENEKKKKDVEMEITWELDFKEKTEKLVNKKISDSQNKTPFEQYIEKRKEKRKEKRELRKKKIAGEEDDSDVPSDVDLNDPYFAEEFKNNEFKQRNKKKVNKSNNSESEENTKEAELSLLLMNEDDDKKHFNLKKIQEEETNSKSKKKRKQKTAEKDSKGDDFKIDVNDERFSALFTSHHYNIDPTDPHYKSTKNMETLINEKIKRRCEADDDSDPKKVKTDTKKDHELNVLVKTIKRKTQAFKNKK